MMKTRKRFIVAAMSVIMSLFACLGITTLAKTSASTETASFYLSDKASIKVDESGIRFYALMDAETKKQAEDYGFGFFIFPQSYYTSADLDTTDFNGTLSQKIIVNGEKDKIYSYGDGLYAANAVLTDLHQDSFDIEFTCVAYVFDENGGYTYDYAFIENILATAKARGQTVMLRLMPHSTCERDDVPDWLKEIMPCPARPAGMRVKDSPTDPRYLKLFGKAVEKLGERFDGDETLDCVDVSLGGAWGEGSTAFAEEDMKALMDIYVRVFKNTKLIGQFANLKMLNYISSQRKIGWRADAIGSRKHMNEIYPICFPRVPQDLWKTAPVSFESYWWISEWYRQGWDIDELIEMTLSWHMSTFNTKYLPIPYEWKDKIEYWLTKMGYRFVIKEVEYPETVKAGKNAEITLKLENKGVAPIYNKLPLALRFKGEKQTFEMQTGVDITKWLPGEYVEKLSVAIPNDLENGEYELQITIGGEKYPTVQFANEGEKDNGYFVLTNVKIGD